MLINLQGYGVSLIQGFGLTAILGVSSLFVSMIFGILAAIAATHSKAWIRSISFFYTTIIRGVPDLVLLFLIFYGGQILLNKITDLFGLQMISLNQFWAGVLTIGFIFGAFMAETFRGAILAVPKGQNEAAIACGMKKLLIFRRIILPQAMRHALPGIGNNWLVMLKTTALVSLIGLDDLVRRADNAGKALRDPFTFYLMASIGFLIFTSISIVIFKYLEKRYNTGFK
ncbi:histidine ABC transporter permease [Gammaproteobacteria bacterium]|nr:histidine ABC transporter permease [Gammaproteobacteria bacterium]